MPEKELRQKNERGINYAKKALMIKNKKDESKKLFDSISVEKKDLF